MIAPIKKYNSLILCAILMLLTSNSTEAQDNNYWHSQVGTRALLLSGATIADVKDNSALYNNPAAIIAVSKTRFGLTSAAFALDELKIQDGAGNGLDVLSNDLLTINAVISFTWNSPNKKLVYSAGVFNASQSRTDSRVDYRAQMELLEEHEGEEIYTSSWNIITRSREDLAGFGLSKAVGGFSLGISQFATFNNMDYYEFLNASASPIDQNETVIHPLRTIQKNRQLKARSVGTLTKIGLGRRYNNIVLGLVLTTPRINIPWFKNSSINQLSAEYDQMTGNNVVKYSALNRSCQYQSPWIVDLGMKWARPAGDLSLRCSYFSRINSYEVISDYEGNAYSGFQNANLANRNVVNFALGYDAQLSENRNLLLGFSSDFNNQATPNRNPDDFNPRFGQLNLWHCSGGLNWNFLGHNIMIGIRYSRGYANNREQLINLTDPDPVTLVGETSPIAKSTYQRFNLIIGYYND